MNTQYEYIITGRKQSIFHSDLERFSSELTGAIKNSRIAVIGAAGSIGSSVVKALLRFQPKAISLIDLSENNLVEVVRDLRSTENLYIPEEFETLPIGLGSIEFSRYMQAQKPFDYIFNLSAIKHVRSEKNIYCLMRMFDTNVLFLHNLLNELNYPLKKFFSVSSDKAANPANLMGASKMAMEEILLFHANQHPFSTARFANVAFSDGSLPHGFIQRINKHQPLSAPNDVKRYFISHQEAGELCVLSGVLGENRDVFFPQMAQEKDEKTFSQIALDLLAALGYEPILCKSEDEAKSRTEELIPQKKWPCYFFKTDTSGEKSFEEFFTTTETTDFETFENIGVIKRENSSIPTTNIQQLLQFLESAKTMPAVTKEDYVKETLNVVPTLSHIETGKNLDQKM